VPPGRAREANDGSGRSLRRCVGRIDRSVQRRVPRVLGSELHQLRRAVLAIHPRAFPTAVRPREANLLGGDGRSRCGLVHEPPLTLARERARARDHQSMDSAAPSTEPLPTKEVKCHPGGPEKQMMDLGVVCADVSAGSTDLCNGECRAYWEANYTNCVAPFWQFIPAPFRPPFDRVKQICLAATAEATAGLCSFGI
jgi:hypothetical protein